jgi:hypothetical protein
MAGQDGPQRADLSRRTEPQHGWCLHHAGQAQRIPGTWEKDYFLILKATLREQLANINTTAMSALEESEQKELFVAYTQRMAYEKEIRDPDDCYLMVLKREEELQSQGQPSRIGILLGMRHVTREEILSGSFAAEADDADDDQGEEEEESDDASE